jgi:enoyl-CoA hydratase
MSDEVQVVRRGPIQIITINRPAAKNALNLAVATGVRDAVDQLDADEELRVAILTGAGGNFSSGMDLKAFLAGESPEIEGRGLCGITETLPRKPLIGAVEGWALAGGFELLLACDLIIAGRTARFGVPEVKRGLVAGGGAALLLGRRIAPTHALQLLLTCDPISAERAAQIGLVNSVVEEGKAVDGALELADRICQNGPLAVAVTKQISKSAPDWTTSEGWKRQRKLMEPVFYSEDAREGATAFAERRSPVWKGR